MSNFYRAEVGRAGDGARPPKARDTGRGMRSRAEFLKPRPPDGVKRRRGALAEFRRRRKGCECDGVGSRREETPRGKGAKRPVVIQKLHIDDGCLGGGDEDFDNDPQTTWPTELEAYWDDNTIFAQNRKKIFHYCVFGNEKDGRATATGTATTKYSYFALWCDNINTNEYMAHVFLHELGHNLLGRNYDEASVTNAGLDINTLPDNALASHFTGDPISEYWHGGVKYWRWAHCTDSNCLMVQGTTHLDYCDDCWNAMYLPGCFRFEENPTTHDRTNAWSGEEGVDY